MIEIIAIIMLCNKNKNNAQLRGRKPGGFIALTIVLWIGMEFVGAMIGAAAGLDLGVYLLALIFAVIGGIISYQIAKNCRPGEYASPTNTITGQIIQNAEPLSLPARIDIIRDKSFVGAIVKWTFILNGAEVGVLSNGATVTATTDRKQNILTAKDSYGSELPPFTFDMADSGYAVIHFKGGKFVHAQTTGTLPSTIPNVQYAPPSAPPAYTPPSAPPAYTPPSAPPAYTPPSASPAYTPPSASAPQYIPPQAPPSETAAQDAMQNTQQSASPGMAVFCSECGQKFDANASFCNNCGAQRKSV